MENRRTTGNNALRIILALVALGAIVGVAALAYIYVSGGSGEASQPISAPTLEDVGAETADSTAEASGVIFNIVPTESEVRFILNEDLRGQPNTVIGRTDQVAGQRRYR